MPIENNQAAAWLCLLAGILLYAFRLGVCLKKRGTLRAGRLWVLLLPGIIGLLLARGGYALLQWEETYASFRWCYTTGLLGMTAGTALAARLCGAKTASVLDETAAAACLCMAMARLSQRWLGETGVGPILESEGFFAMINEWEEPVLATWMIETGICLLAALLTGFWQRRNPRTAGGTFCGAVHFLLDPQILAEQFRSGEYMRFMMMRLEQALFGLFALGTLIWLGFRIRKAGKSTGTFSAFFPAFGYVLLAGIIALAEFLLDGKILESFPEGAGWMMFSLAVTGMIAVAVRAVRRLDRAEEKTIG